MNEERVLAHLSQLSAGVDRNSLCGLLMWFGVLGICAGAEDIRFIWDFEYDAKILAGWQRKWRAEGTLQYGVNPAFWPALGVTN